MSAKKMLNPDQFRIEPSSDADTHSLDIYHPDHAGGTVPVGTMIWSRQTGAIHNIQSDVRRQGIATRMFEHSQQFDPPAKHNTPENRTKLGKKWAAGVGGESV